MPSADSIVANVGISPYTGERRKNAEQAQGFYERYGIAPQGYIVLNNQTYATGYNALAPERPMGFNLGQLVDTPLERFALAAVAGIFLIVLLRRR